MTMVNSWKPLQTIVTKSSILDVAAALDPDLIVCINPFQLSVALLYPLKTKLLGFLMFSGGIASQQWAEMG